MPGTKRKLKSVDEFFDGGLDSSSDESEATQKQSTKRRVKESGKGERGGKESTKKKAVAHKASLQNLQEKDPEFYKFLQKEGQELLNFDPDDISDSDEDSEAEGDPNDPAPKLEVATDSEDEEEEGQESKKSSKKKAAKTKVTVKMVNQWSKALIESDSLQAFHQAVGAFKAAVLEAGSENNDVTTRYTVEGTTVFNAIVRLCITDMLPMLTRVLRLPQKKDSQKQTLPSSSNKWKKVKADVKSYLTDVLQFVTDISEPAILNVILKHLHQLTPYFACFPKLTKQALKRLVTVWSAGEETSRVLAFLSINKLTRLCQNTVLEFVIKHMYMAYVKNCKFTSPTTLPMINFMQRSLVEVFVLDVTAAYQFAFIYIRQLAIHLRNAITVKKKDTTQAVYNWQYVHSLHLWVRLLSQVYPCETLEPLIYPLTQVIIGTLKLIPTTRYYPLRFHCVRALNMLSDATNTYIPTLPFLTEILRTTDFNKKYSSTSLKPFNFACILKLSKAQLTEKAFKDGVMDQLYELLLEGFTINSHCVGFPELALPSLMQMKAFVKKCKVPNYSKVIKQLVDKVTETSNMITRRRKAAGLRLSDMKGVDAWERRSKEEGTPLISHQKQYRKKREAELQQEIAGRDMIKSEDLPSIRRPVLQKASQQEKEEFKGLFGSGSDTDSDSERFLLKEERTKKSKKQKSKKMQEDEDSDSDMYSDFDDEEMAALDRSVSEEDEDDDDDEESESGEFETDESESGEFETDESESGEFEDDESEDFDSESESEEVKTKSKKTKPGKTQVGGKKATKTKGKKFEMEIEDGSDDGDMVEDFHMSDFGEDDED